MELTRAAADSASTVVSVRGKIRGKFLTWNRHGGRWRWWWRWRRGSGCGHGGGHGWRRLGRGGRGGSHRGSRLDRRGRGLLGLGGEKLHGHLRGRFGNWVRLRLNWLGVSVRVSCGSGRHCGACTGLLASLHCSLPHRPLLLHWEVLHWSLLWLEELLLLRKGLWRPGGKLLLLRVLWVLWVLWVLGVELLWVLLLRKGLLRELLLGKGLLWELLKLLLWELLLRELLLRKLLLWKLLLGKLLLLGKGLLGELLESSLKMKRGKGNVLLVLSEALSD